MDATYSVDGRPARHSSLEASKITKTTSRLSSHRSVGPAMDHQVGRPLVCPRCTGREQREPCRAAVVAVTCPLRPWVARAPPRHAPNTFSMRAHPALGSLALALNCFAPRANDTDHKSGFYVCCSMQCILAAPTIHPHAEKKSPAKAGQCCSVGASSDGPGGSGGGAHPARLKGQFIRWVPNHACDACHTCSNFSRFSSRPSDPWFQGASLATASYLEVLAASVLLPSADQDPHPKCARN